MLEIKNVFKSYKDNAVLKGVSLNVKNNEIKGLIGVNGAGKSTLIELTCGVKSIDSGSIVLNGITVGDKRNKDAIKFTIGYMPQGFNLFNDLTVEENLGYLCAVYHLDKDIEIDKEIVKDINKISNSNRKDMYHRLQKLFSNEKLTNNVLNEFENYHNSSPDIFIKAVELAEQQGNISISEFKTMYSKLKIGLTEDQVVKHNKKKKFSIL